MFVARSGEYREPTGKFIASEDVRRRKSVPADHAAAATVANYR